MSAELKSRIEQIPGDEGWHKKSAQEDFEDVANQLTEEGFTQDQVIEILARLYWATASCYGD